jgi:nucleotide-binding universal stress UspA family protein
VVIVVGCYAVFGTSEDTYLAIYAIGVFILLSMTSCAALKRLLRNIRLRFSWVETWNLVGISFAALFTSVATVIVFVERFQEGAWTYLIFLPVLYITLSVFRARLGAPVPLAEHLGRLYSGQYLLPYRKRLQPERENPFEDIAIPLDGSPLAEQALPISEALGRHFQSRLTLISAEANEVSAGPGTQETVPTNASSDTDREAQAYLAQIAAKLREDGLAVDSLFNRGRPELVIPAIARDIGADLLVLTTHGRSPLERLFLSDTSTRILRRSPSPVLLVRPKDDPEQEQTRFNRLLVCLDGSENAETVLPYARAIAARCHSEILLLAVPEGDFAAPTLRKYLEGMADDLRRRGLNAKPIVSGSGPARTVLEWSESEDIDLILLASQGRGGLDRAVEIGSVAERVMQSSQRPVLLVFASQQRSQFLRVLRPLRRQAKVEVP